MARSNVTTHWLQRGTALTARQAPECPPRACLNTGATRMHQDGCMEPTPPPWRASYRDMCVFIGKTVAAVLTRQSLSETVDYFMYTN